MEARFADWSKDACNSFRKADIKPGKNIAWYSFRHTHFTMRLKVETPLQVLVANTNTSMQYIEDHYFHYRTDEETEILSKSRKSHKEADDHLEWTQ